MRAIVAILKDSFREAAASRVLWVALIAIAVVLLALAPLALETSVSNRLRPSELVDVEKFLKSLQQGKESKETPAAHIWSLLSESQKTNIDNWLKPEEDKENGDSRRVRSQVLEIVNEHLQQPDFYRAESWAAVEMNDELKPAESAPAGDRLLSNRNVQRLAAAFPQSIVINDAAVLTLWYGSIPTSLPIPLPPSQINQLIDGTIIGVLSIFLGFLGIAASLLVTAGMIPKTFEPGEISLLLSKPVRRSVLFITKFAGGCMFTLICATLLVGGVWLLVWFRFDLWRPELLLCVPLYVFLFAIYFSVSAFAGAIWRNAIVSLALVVAFWVVLTTAGAVQGVLGTYLMSQQITDVTVAGDDVFSVSSSRTLNHWSAETNDWAEVLADNNGESFGRSMQQFASAGMRPRVVATPDGSQIYSLEPGFSRASGANSATLLSGLKENNYQRESEGGTSEPVFGIFMANNGDIILPGTRSVSKFVGLTDKEKQSRVFLNRFLGGLVPMSSSKAFESLTPTTMPAIRADAAVAFNHGDDSLVIRDNGKLMTLIRSEDGKYDIGTTRDFDDKQAAVIASGGKFVLMATADGKLSVVDKSTLETVAEQALPKGDKPKVAEFAADGSWGVVMTHGGSVVLFGGETKSFLRWVPQENGSVSAVGFTSDGQLVVSDGRRSLSFYSLPSPEPVKTIVGKTGFFYHIHDYLISPLYTILPKPSELDNAVSYLVTGEKSVAIGGNDPEGDETATENLQQTRISFDLWSSFWSNLGFVAVMLLAGCVYLSRKDF